MASGKILNLKPTNAPGAPSSMGFDFVQDDGTILPMVINTANQNQAGVISLAILLAAASARGSLVDLGTSR